MPKKTVNSQQLERLTALVKLIRVLATKRYLTLNEIAQLTGCTYAGATKRVERLRESGCRIESKPAPAGRIGAPASVYRLTHNAASRRLIEQARHWKKIVDRATSAA